MGLWWKKVSEEEVLDIAAAHPKAVVTIDSCPTSVPKDIWQKWRKLQPWVILEIKKHCWSKKNKEQDYYIYFDSFEGTMRYRQRLTGTFVAVRVGLKPIRFIVGPTHSENTIKEPMELLQWSGLLQRGLSNEMYYSLNRDDTGVSPHFLEDKEIVWI